MSDEGRWVDDPPLPELPTPPGPDVQLSLGARRLRVYAIKTGPAGTRRAGFREIAVIARARLKDGGIGLLAGWIGGWQQHARVTGGPRWAWLRYDPPREGGLDPIVPMPIARDCTPTGEYGWHGYHKLSDFAKAIRGAAATLPRGKRAAALKPLPDLPRSPDAGK